MGGPLMAIRPMVIEDIAEVCALEMAEQIKPWSEGMFRHELDAPGRAYFVAEGEEIVGFGGVMVVGDEAHVTNLLVSEGFRGNGIGRRLLRSLVFWAVGEGAQHLTLEVRPSNISARNLYAQMGLAPVGIRPGYYGDEDALIMWAHDIDQREDAGIH